MQKNICASIFYKDKLISKSAHGWHKGIYIFALGSISKGFVIPFESGVIAIRDWRINNDLKNDRYRPSLYTEEKEALLLDDSKRYILDTYCFQPGSDLETEHNVTQPNVT